MAHGKSFTGRRRERKTHWSVHARDLAARIAITLGGIGTIAAVLMVSVFLFSVAAWLFVPAALDDAVPVKIDIDQKPLHFAVDDYNTMAWALLPNGKLQVYELATGKLLATEEPFGDRIPTATSFSVGKEDVAFGFVDGTVQQGTISFDATFLSEDKVPEELRKLKQGESAVLENGVVEVTTQNQFRMQTLAVELEDPVEVADSEIRLIDHIVKSSGMRSVSLYCTLSADGALQLNEVTKKGLMAFGAPEAERHKIPYQSSSGHPPAHLLMSSEGENTMLFLAWEDGKLQRFNVLDPEHPQLADELNVIPDKDAKLTACQHMVGRATFITGDTRGRLRAWFPARPQEPIGTADGFHLYAGHDLPSINSAVTSLGFATRTRMIIAGYENGSVRVLHVTAENVLADRELGQGPILSCTIAPKEDALVALVKTGLWAADFNPRYPEATLAGLFLPVWYEGRDQPETVWQTSSGSEGAEPKLGLWPLVFGTIKATIYCMLIAVPLALLAAVYTSEFLHPKTKAKVKPTIEMMASLPSVVLGFLAGNIIAEFVQQRVGIVIISLLTIPLVYLAGGYLWQLLPLRFTIRWQWARLVAMVPLLLLGPLIAIQLAPTVENWFFAGDLMRWLDGKAVEHRIAEGWNYSYRGVHGQIDGDTVFTLSGNDKNATLRFVSGSTLAQATKDLQEAGQPLGIQVAMDEAEGQITFTSAGQAAVTTQIGNAIGAWLFLFIPLSALAVMFLMNRVINPRLLEFSSRGGWTRDGFAVLELLKFILGCALTLGIALVISSLLDLAGWDPRGSYLDTYVQRNALICGFAMGFAVVPIIYTIADDALAAVPEHLRSASLRSATPAQTAMRVIIPTAMSGLFSAVMIGLGRAVGETMIVLMATGNTPVKDWNVFNGFRTLSASIAVEMPEAAKGTTHFRTLFLAALVLFAMTFVVNTIAEVVRLRFRRRAYAL